MRAEGAGELVLGEEVSKRLRPIRREHDEGVEVRGVDLTDELPTASTRGEDVHSSITIEPHRGDSLDAKLSRRHHGGDGGRLGAEPRTRARVNAHTAKHGAPYGGERCTDVSYQAPTHRMRVDG